MCNQMPLYIVSYDLNEKESKSYKELYDALQTYPFWAHPLESTWVVSTDHSAKEVCERLRLFLGQNDNLLVVEFNKEAGYWGWLSKSFWEWLKKRLES